MQFVLIYKTADRWIAGEANPRLAAAIGSLIEDMSQSGVLSRNGSSPGLRRGRNGIRGKPPLTDGPFTEAKEVIGG